jgi:hypothetical protein
MSSLLQRTTAWLCLAVILLTGITPAQRGFVLCLEEDGCVRVEVKALDGNCAGCEGHAALAVAEQPASSLAGPLDCPCIDLAVVAPHQEHRVLPKPVHAQLGPWFAPEPVASPLFAVVDGHVHAAPTSVPRPPDSLALIHSVVLLL